MIINYKKSARLNHITEDHFRYIINKYTDTRIPVCTESDTVIPFNQLVTK